MFMIINNDVEKEVIMARFLRKLMNQNTWGGKHTESKNLVKSLPKHLRGRKLLVGQLKNCINWTF